MPPIARREFQRAFTLFELMIVIVIIGVVYALVGAKMVERSPKSLTMESLPSYLASKRFEKTAEVVCTQERCTDCRLFLDGHPTKEKLKLFRDKPEAYTVLPDDTLKEALFYPLYDDEGHEERVCFRYEMRYNRSGDELIVKRYGSDKAWLLRAFGKPLSFESEFAARDYLVNLKSEFLDGL